MNPPLVSIITINYNALEETLELLESIAENSFKNVEVIVVDNASIKDPSQSIRNKFPSVKVIRSEENLGFAGGNNLGISHSTGAFLFFVNNDAELTEGVIESLLSLFSDLPKLGVVSPKLCFYNAIPGTVPDMIQYAGATFVHPLTGRNRILGTGALDDGTYREARPTAYAHGAAMMVPREVLVRAGMMPEHFFLYYEELDWCEAIRRCGYQVYVDNRVRVYHKESLSVSRLGTLKTYYLTRNRLLFMRRNQSLWRRWVFILFLLFVTLPVNLLRFTYRRQFRELWAFLRGLWWNFTTPRPPAQIPFRPANHRRKMKVL